MSLASVARAACLWPLLALVACAHPTAEDNTAPQPQILPAFPPLDPLTKLTLSLIPQDDTILQRTLQELSDPLHERYARHLTREEAFDLLTPAPGAIECVTTWLREAGVQDQHIQRQGQFLHATIPVAAAASLLKRAARTDAETATTVHGSYAIPDTIREHVRAVYLGSTQDEQAIRISAPTGERRYGYSEMPHNRPGRSIGGCDDDKLTPSCIREKYHMNGIPHTSTKKTVLGVVGFSGQAAQFKDLESFLKAFDPSSVGANFTQQFINGGTNPQGNFPGGEANLDIQYAVALAAANVDVRFYSVGGKNFDFIPDLDLPKTGSTEPYLQLATTLAALPDAALPSVLSLSYGVNEQLLPRAYAQHVCDVLGQLSARGVSVLAASGDAGPGQSCQANDGSGRTRFLPAFPASCPYVTAVGATRGARSSDTATVEVELREEEEEEETTLELSGGGFSDYFERPPYQDGVVGEYVKAHGKQWEGLFNENGRGIPDVAALGEGYQMYNHGAVEIAGGTSASTPVVAAMVAVLNSLRAQKGKPSLGLLNTWLYRHLHSGFTDITTGTSRGCPGISYAGLPSPHVPDAGWPADKGWDAATGWGTPVFSRLRRLACV